MIKLVDYQTWDKAFFLLGAKGSPHTEPFDFSKEEFFVKGTLFSKRDARTFSAFSHWVVLNLHLLDLKKVEELLKSTKYDKALLGFYLDVIDNPNLNQLSSYAQKNEETEILSKVSEPDEVLLRWGIRGKPLCELASKYLVFDLTKNRIF